MANSKEKSVRSFPGQLEPDVVKMRSDRAWKVKDLWRGILQECYELVLSARNPYVGSEDAPRIMDRQFDSTATNAAFRLVNRLIMGFTPPDMEWVEVVPGPLMEMQYSPAQLKQLKPHLEKVSRIASVIFNGAGMVNARWEAWLDMVISGLGVKLLLEDPNDDAEPVIGQAVSQAEVAIEQDLKGNVIGVHRRRNVKVRKIDGFWDDAVLTKELQDMIKDPKADPEVAILESSYKGSHPDALWLYEVLWCNSDTPHRIVSRKYEQSPWQIFQWMRLPSCPYGPGPVLLALADIRTLNKVAEMLLKNAALAMAGMYLVRDDGVVNPSTITITQGGMIPVASTGGGSHGASIVPLSTNREFDLGQLVVEKLQDSVRKALYDTSLPPMTGAVRSATEFIQRAREVQQDIGGGASRVSMDVASYVRRGMEILIRRGLVPPMKIDQLTLKVQINAPLVRAQSLTEVETAVQWYEMGKQLAGPELPMLEAKVEELFRWAGDKMGVSADLMRSEEERAGMEDKVAGLIAGMRMRQQAGGALSGAMAA